MTKISSTTLLVVAITILKVALVALLSALMILFVFIFINDSCGNDLLLDRVVKENCQKHCL
jgi:hypothetical protein